MQLKAFSRNHSKFLLKFRQKLKLELNTYYT